MFQPYHYPTYKTRERRLKWLENLFDDIENIAMTLRSILRDLPKRLEANLEEVNAMEREIMDIEHVLELSNFNAAKGYQYAKDIQVARKRRRELKDENEQLEHLVEVIKKLNFKENDLNKAIGHIRKIKEHHGKRTYKMRIRQDLQHVVDSQNEFLLEVVK